MYSRPPRGSMHRAVRTSSATERGACGSRSAVAPLVGAVGSRSKPPSPLAPRLAAASHCDYRIDDSAIPLSVGCTLNQALTDGEDFELLFAVSPRVVTKLERAWRRKFPNLALTRIGALTARSTSCIPHSPRGFDHFAQR